MNESSFVQRHAAAYLADLGVRDAEAFWLRLDEMCSACEIPRHTVRLNDRLFRRAVAIQIAQEKGPRMGVL